MKAIKVKKRNPNIYEHLEHYVKHTTYAQRLQWLEQANAFVRMIGRKRKKGTLFAD